MNELDDEEFREEQKRLQQQEEEAQQIATFAGLRDSQFSGFSLVWDEKLKLSRLNIESASSSQDLEVLGLDMLKSELIKLGIKCGGTLHDRAERLFLTKGVTDVLGFLSQHPELAPGRDKEKRSRSIIYS